MTALPRGHCSTCSAEVALRKGGLVREHRGPLLWNARTHDWSRSTGVCRGSGKKARR